MQEMSSGGSPMCVRKANQETPNYTGPCNCRRVSDHFLASQMDMGLTDEASTRRVSILEGQFGTMQNQMMGMQSTLERILNVIQNPSSAAPPPHSAYPHHNGAGGSNYSNADRDIATPASHLAHQHPRIDTDIQMISSSGPPSMSIGRSASPQSSTQPMSAQSFYLPGPSDFRVPPPRHHHGHDDSSSSTTLSSSTPHRGNNFPPLPGFAPPVSNYCHKVLA